MPTQDSVSAYSEYFSSFTTLLILKYLVQRKECHIEFRYYFCQNQNQTEGIGLDVVLAVEGPPLASRCMFFFILGKKGVHTPCDPHFPIEISTRLF